MPWTTGDVDQFKSGLTQAQKRQWVRIANSALRRCQERGGSDCEASAIRQANGVVGNKEQNNMMQYILQTNSAYQVREETLNGSKHIVVPVTMMVEGVHNGSAGPLFHPAEELGRYPASWNGMPVVINHPEVGGRPVSANSPDVLEAVGVGTIYNAQMEQEKLRAEAWFDEQRLIAVSPETYERVQRGEPLEVSVGIFSDDEHVEGEWNGEQYTAIARNHRPDHLAILPDNEGACSLEDGCGVRANKEGGKNDMKINDDVLKELRESKQKLTDNGLAVNQIETNQEGVDYRELVRDVQGKLDRWDNEDRIHYLQALYDEYLIYQIRRARDGSEEYYRQEYQVNDDGSIEFTGEPTQVQKRVEFVTAQSKGKSILSNILKLNTMSKNKKQQQNNNCCEEKVDQLIANESTQWGKDDRDDLLQLDEAVIDKMFPVEQNKSDDSNDPSTNKKEEGPETGKTAPTNSEEGEKKVTKEDIQQAMKEMDTETYLDNAPREVAEQLREGLRLNKEKRSGLIEGITNNSDWSEEEVKDWDTNKLQKLYRSVVPDETDYSVTPAGYGASGNKKPSRALKVMLGFDKQKETEKQE